MANKGGIAKDRLRSFIERIERLEEEKAALTGDIREVILKPTSAIPSARKKSASASA